MQSKQVLERQAQARAEALLEVVHERLGAIPEGVADAIRAGRDVGQLKQWLKAASRARGMSDFLGQTGLGA